MEGSGGDFKLWAHSLHHLQRLPPWVLGRSRHRYCHPRGQTDSEVIDLEGGGPVTDIFGPAQGVCHLGQVQMPLNLRGIRRGTLIMPAPPDILGPAEDGGEGGRLIWVGVSGNQGRNAGGTYTPHHLQRGGGCGGMTLGCSDG